MAYSKESKRHCQGRYIEGRKVVEFSDGLFHQWGVDYEEFGDSVGNFTVAIVELPDGKVVAPYAPMIKFKD